MFAISNILMAINALFIFYLRHVNRLVIWHWKCEPPTVLDIWTRYNETRYLPSKDFFISIFHLKHIQYNYTIKNFIKHNSPTLLDLWTLQIPYYSFNETCYRVEVVWGHSEGEQVVYPPKKSWRGFSLKWGNYSWMGDVLRVSIRSGLGEPARCGLRRDNNEAVPRRLLRRTHLVPFSFQ